MSDCCATSKKDDTYDLAVIGAGSKRRGAQTAAELVNFDFRYLLHGDETYAYRAPIYAGEEVAFSTRVVDFYDKKGGAMEFAKLECDVTHAERGVLVRATRTLLHRLPGAAS